MTLLLHSFSHEQGLFYDTPRDQFGSLLLHFWFLPYDLFSEVGRYVKEGCLEI